MKILGVITARALSTRLVNKNLRKIKNKSLVEITINFTKKIEDIYDLVLTTDSRKIQKIGENKKIKIVTKRPYGISMNNSSSASTVIHAVKWYEKKYSTIDAIALFQPTTPFRDLDFIKNCIKKFLKFRKSLISVKMPIQNSGKFQSDGSIYLISKKELFRLKSFNEDFSIKVISKSKNNSIDIDSIKDLDNANKIANIVC